MDPRKRKKKKEKSEICRLTRLSLRPWERSGCVCGSFPSPPNWIVRARRRFHTDLDDTIKKVVQLTLRKKQGIDFICRQRGKIEHKVITGFKANIPARVRQTLEIDINTNCCSFQAFKKNNDDKNIGSQSTLVQFCSSSNNQNSQTL